MNRVELWYFDQNPAELYERFLVPVRSLPSPSDLVIQWKEGDACAFP
ncbi:MAG: hypothetical protein V3V96_08925 [Acidiferrobacterales bacterium]